jgi:hypothetical protein
LKGAPIGFQGLFGLNVVFTCCASLSYPDLIVFEITRIFLRCSITIA